MSVLDCSICGTRNTRTASGCGCAAAAQLPLPVNARVCTSLRTRKTCRPLCVQASQRGKQQADGDALPQHTCQPGPKRQRTLLGRLASMRITSMAAARVAPIKHDADYAGQS